MVYLMQWRDGEIVGKREDIGNVFGQGDVTVLGPDGAVVKRLKTQGSLPTNLAFGQPGSQKIYVTEVEFGSLEVLEVGTDGLPLYTG